MQAPCFDRIPVGDLSRLDWLKERQKGLGGSDAPAVANLSPWNTPLGVYQEKTTDPEDGPTPERFFWGLALEPVIAATYAERLGHGVIRPADMLAHREITFARVSLDGEIVHAEKRPEGRGVLEIKTVDRFAAADWGPSGTDQIPEQYLVQVQHAMLVSGYQWADVAALVGGNELRVYTIQADRSIFDSLLSIEGAFWNGHVLPRKPPAPSFGHDTTLDTLRRLYPGTDGTVIGLDADAQRAHDELVDLKAAIKDMEARADEAKARIMASLGNSSIGLLPNGGGYTRKLVKGGPVSFERQDRIDMRFSKNPKGVK